MRLCAWRLSVLTRVLRFLPPPPPPPPPPLLLAVRVARPVAAAAAALLPPRLRTLRCAVEGSEASAEEAPPSSDEKPSPPSPIEAEPPSPPLWPPTAPAAVFECKWRLSSAAHRAPFSCVRSFSKLAIRAAEADWSWWATINRCRKRRCALPKSAMASWYLPK